MTKLEKVINGLEHYTHEVTDAFVNECFMCPYKDALELLKELEAVKPSVDVDTYVCQNCEYRLVYSFYPSCGKAVKWDD